MSAVLPQTEASTRAADAMTLAPAALDQAAPTPADRLAASRERLRAALMTIAHPPPKPSLLDSIGMGQLKDQLKDRVRAVPGAALLLETLERWWAEHPLKAAATMAGHASSRFIEPIAQKNPLGLLIGAAVVGALFVVARPWRWLLRPALFVGLVPQLAAQVMKRMPLESWMNVFAAAAKSKSSSASSPVDRTAGAPMPPDRSARSTSSAQGTAAEPSATRSRSAEAAQAS
jgi:hypothetical protein